MRWTAGAWRLLVIAILATLTLSPTVPVAAQEVSRVYVGRVTGASGADALIAIVVEPGGNAAAYACSKDDGWNLQFSKWFQGQLSPQGQLSAKSNDGTEVTGTLQGSQLSGQLGSLSWSADLVTSGTAGLFRGRAGDEVHAVIEAPDGTRVGRVWSVVTGAHVGTWDFSTATATPIGGGLRVQRNQPEFIQLELTACTNAFC
jgi:hypothetical protein